MDKLLVLRSPQRGRLEGRFLRAALSRSAKRVIPIATSLGLGYEILSSASIYILQCADGSYYTGITRRSVEERLSEHVQGLIPGCHTDARRPVRLMFSEHYERIDEAIAAERRIKG